MMMMMMMMMMMAARASIFNDIGRQLSLCRFEKLEISGLRKAYLQTRVPPRVILGPNQELSRALSGRRESLVLLGCRVWDIESLFC